MTYRVKILLFLSLISMSSHVLTAQNEGDWKKIGTATFSDNDLAVALGDTSNTIKTAKYGTVHLRHKYIDSLQVEKEEENFKASFRKLKDVSITLENLRINDSSATSDFIIHLKSTSLPESSVSIKLDDKTLPKDKIEMIKSYFLPVIHDYLTDYLVRFQNNSCIEKAIRACGKENVKYIDVNIFATGCAFKCQ
ncbi:MAG TPA: hypothetical protein VK021_08040 [Flavobacteriaceae bacterium]|nr:hypothetical protein [Flavobacteriaceae bacterium]